jgi:hypothetical protein
MGSVSEEVADRRRAAGESSFYFYFAAGRKALEIRHDFGGGLALTAVAGNLS